jgi:hypothetical protein
MGGQPSIVFACVCALLTHFFVASTSTRAQDTNGAVLIGGGLVQAAMTRTTMKVDGAPAQSTTLLQSPLDGRPLLTVGFGLGSWVLAVEAALVYSPASVDVEYDYEYSAYDIKRIVERTEIRLGPSARYLFGDGEVRPFIEAGVGLGVRTSDNASDASSQGNTLYAHAGPGAQLRLSSSASLDLALHVGYATTSGELKPAIVGSRFNATTGLYAPIYSSPGPEYAVQQITADLAARLSIWL